MPLEVLFSELTGRWAAIDPSSRGVPAVEARLARLGVVGEVDPAALIPCRHRRVLLLPARPALWAPDPERPGAGGWAYQAVLLDEAGVAVWRAINGARTTAQVAAAAGVPLAVALERLRAWTRRDVQAAQLRDAPPRPRDPGLLALCGPAREAGVRTADQRDERGATTLREWHLRIGGDRHFDRVETTVAHVLRDPHPALAQAPAVRLPAERLAARGLAVDGPIVEVGCGDGALAAAWGPCERYLRVDLSPGLLAEQARAAPDTLGVLADAVRLPLRAASVGLLLSNEVLADLPSVPAAAVDPDVEGRLVRYGLARPTTWANLGAWRFVEEIGRVLAPGGRAFLSEFGGDDAPEEAVQLDHPEVSIDFAALERVARGQGLAVERVRLDDLLGLDLGAPQLARHSWLALRALAPELPARAWTPATLPLAEEVVGLEWTTMAGEGPGPLVTRFEAVLLAR